MDGPKHRSNTSLNCTALQSVSFWPVTSIEFHRFECGCGVFSLHLQICILNEVVKTAFYYYLVNHQSGLPKKPF